MDWIDFGKLILQIIIVCFVLMVLVSMFLAILSKEGRSLLRGEFRKGFEGGGNHKRTEENRHSDDDVC